MARASKSLTEFASGKGYGESIRGMGLRPKSGYRQKKEETKVDEHLKDRGKKAKGFLGEFKEFALRGNVMDLAVGVIIGAAFGAVVTSLTDNIISPIIGIFLRGNLDAMEVTIFGATLRYGAFITSIINFIIIAFIVFLLVKGMNRLAAAGSKKKADAPPTTKKCPYCFTDIPIEATRCPNCTAMLGDAPPAA